MRIFISFIFFFIACSSPSADIVKSTNQTKFPRLTSSPKGDIFLSWFEEIESKRWALMSSIFHRNRWSKPSTVTSGRSYFINWADFPSVNHISQDTLVAHWLEKSGSGTYDYDVQLSFSFNNGETWSSSQIPHSTMSKGEHGFSSFGIGFDYHDLVWLDGRNMIMDHNKSDYGQMSLYHSIFSSNGKLGKEYQIDERVCECCPTASVKSGNALVVAYRNRSLDEIRDIYIARRVGKVWEKPYPVFKDNWKITGCPVNGPMMALNLSKIAIAWYTSANNSPMVKVAFSKDTGKTFSLPIRVDLSMPIGRVDIEWINNEEVIVSWLESGKDSSNIFARKVSIDNTISEETLIQKIPPGRVTGYPQMEIWQNKALFAWTEMSKNSKISSKWVMISDIGK